jgi:hypothetical protein
MEFTTSCEDEKVTIATSCEDEKAYQKNQVPF